MGKYIITISRQFGSLGRPIAKEMASILNVEYYDRYIVGKAANNMEMDISEVENIEEAVTQKYKNMKFPFGKQTTEMQDSVFENQKKIILDLAEKEASCIIVGRCSDYILRNYKNHLSIFIYAPYYERLKNCIDTLQLSPDDAKRTLDDVDAAREAYYQHYAKTTMTDPSLRSLMIDSSILGVEGTARLLVDFASQRFNLKTEE